MPYEIKKNGPKAKPYCVYNRDTGARKGCSTSKKKAEDHIKVLNMREAGVPPKKEIDAPTPAPASDSPVQDAPLVEIQEFLDAQAREGGPEKKDAGELEAEGGSDEAAPVLPVEGKSESDDGDDEASIEKDVSYEELASRVRRAFHRQFRNRPDPYSWVDRVYPEGYLIAICSETERLYKHTYELDDDGKYVFSEGELVEITYEEKEKEEKGIIAKILALTQGIWDKVIKQEESESEPSLPVLITKQQEDGRWRWIMVSSTAFLDRDTPKEIVSKEAVARSVGRADANSTYGELLFWHEKGVILGSCDFQAQHGLCLIESGLWSESEMGEAARKDINERPGYWGVSIGFLPGHYLEGVRIKGTHVQRVWTDIQIVERSVLPAEKAASLFTSVQNVGGQKRMDEQKKVAMEGLLGKELAEQILSRADAINNKATEPGAVFKEQDEDLTLTDRLVKFADSVAEEDSDVSAIIKAVAETLTEEEEVQETKPEPEPAEVMTMLKDVSEQLTGLQKELAELKEGQAPRAALFQRPTSLSGPPDNGQQTKGLEDGEPPRAVQLGASKLMAAVGLE